MEATFRIAGDTAPSPRAVCLDELHHNPKPRPVHVSCPALDAYILVTADPENKMVWVEHSYRATTVAKLLFVQDALLVAEALLAQEFAQISTETWFWSWEPRPVGTVATATPTTLCPSCQQEKPTDSFITCTDCGKVSLCGDCAPAVFDDCQLCDDCHRNTCDICNGKGLIHYPAHTANPHPAARFGHIERCDSCDVYESDLAAARATGLKFTIRSCDTLEPCNLDDSVCNCFLDEPYRDNCTALTHEFLILWDGDAGTYVEAYPTEEEAWAAFKNGMDYPSALTLSDYTAILDIVNRGTIAPPEWWHDEDDYSRYLGQISIEGVDAT
jgi:hypothetical protein